MITSTINAKSQERHFFSVTHASASLKRVIIYTSVNPKYAETSVALPSWVNSKLKKPAAPLKPAKRMPVKDSKGLTHTGTFGCAAGRHCVDLQQCHSGSTLSQILVGPEPKAPGSFGISCLISFL
jgi:hypothetical protein